MANPMPGPSGAAGPARWILAPFAIGLALALWLAADGRLSGDEPSYLYAARYLSAAQLVAGEVQPSGIPGFLQGRILHLFFLKGVMGIAGGGQVGFRLVQAIHFAILILNLVVVARILRALLPAVAEVRAATLALAATPISLYLAFKTTPDNEALLCGLVATLGLIRIAEGRRGYWMAATAVALAAAALTKNQMIFIPAAFWLAGCFAPLARVQPRRLAGLGAVCGIAGAALTIAVLEITGVGVHRYVESYGAPFENTTPLIAKLMNLGTELGLAWLVLPFALLSRRRHEVVSLTIWLGAVMAPFLFLSGVEPRHVAVNLAPAGGLIALALESLRERWARPAGWAAWHKGLAMTLGVLVLMAANAGCLPIMPHRVDLGRVRSLLARLDELHGANRYALLPASAYGDFHIIRVLWPDRDVRFVAVPVLAVDAAQGSREDALRGYFGNRYCESLPELAGIEKPLVFFGFHSTLAAENLRAMLARASPSLADRVMSHVHLVQHLYTEPTEWLWKDPRVRLSPVARSGPYEAFDVFIRCRPCG